MPIPREEQESVQTCGWGQDTMTFATTNPAHVRHMERLGIKPGRISQIDGQPVAWTFTCPASWFVLPRPKKRVSEERRQALSERNRVRAQQRRSGESA